MADSELTDAPETERTAAFHLTARGMLDPYFRHARVAVDSAAKTLGWPVGDDVASVYPAAIRDRCEKAGGGDLSEVSRMLMAQALTLDTIFTELAASAASMVNVDAAERLLRLALTAQDNGRATLEALTKLHQPCEQAVRHIHDDDSSHDEQCALRTGVAGVR